MAIFLRCAVCFLKICLWAAYTGLCSFSVALRWRYFLKNAPKKMGYLYGDPVLSPPRYLFFFGVAVFLRCAVCFFKFAFWAVYTGTSVLSLLRHLFFLGRGVCFFSAFNAVLFCVFVVGRAGRAYVFCCFWALGACLGLPSVGFVNAV